jgi:hypothetical protein
VVSGARKAHTVKVKDNVLNGLRVVLPVAPERILEAAEPRLVDLEVVVLDLLEVDLERRAPAANGRLRVVVEEHRARGERDPNERLAARQELDARLFECGRELLLV